MERRKADKKKKKEGLWRSDQDPRRQEQQRKSQHSHNALGTSENADHPLSGATQNEITYMKG